MVGSPPPVKKATLNFHYTVVRREILTSTSCLKNSSAAARVPCPGSPQEPGSGPCLELVLPHSTAQHMQCESWRKAHPELAGAQAVGEKRLLTPGAAPTLTDSQCCTRSHVSVSELRFTPPSEAKIIQTDAQLQVLDSLQGQTLPQRLHQAPAHASKAKQGSFPSQRPQELLNATSKGKI